MEDSLFKSLNSGTRFNKKRFGDQIQLFSNGKKKSAVAASVGGSGDNSTGPASTLDFFGNSELKPAPASKQKRKRKQGSEGNAEGSDGQRKKRKKSKKSKKESKDEARDSGDAAEPTMELFRDGGVACSHEQKSKAAAPNVAQQRAEEIRAFRRRLRIHVKGNAVPDPCAKFEGIPFARGAEHVRHIVLQNVELSKYKEPTPIQMQAIPAMMHGRDVLAVAPTGSGKTASFLLPIIGHTLKAPKSVGIRALILTPTRELAVQILRDFHRLSIGKKFRATVLSKANTGQGTFGANGSQRFDLVIATPLRLVTMLREEQISLGALKCLVMDEADKLFEEGFLQQIDEIIAACNGPDVQRGMFSATMPEGIEEMVQSILRDPVRVQIGQRGAATEMIDQKLLFVGREEGKLLAMRQIIQEGLSPPTMVFVQSKQRATALYRELVYDGINVDVVHADRTKAQRDDIVKRFRMGEVWVLIATDLMARGMDFKGINCVINYDFPQSTVSYVHRIGRTGRAGRKGKAITFFTESDMEYLRSIANVMKISGCDVPEWMLTMKKTNKNRKKYMKKYAPKRSGIETQTGYDKQRIHKKKQFRQQQRPKKGGQ